MDIALAEVRDHVIAEQRRTIERLHKVAYELRKQVERLEAREGKTAAPKKSGGKSRRKPDPPGRAKP